MLIRKELPTHVAIRRNLDYITLSEVSQSQKDTRGTIPLICDP